MQTRRGTAEWRGTLEEGEGRISFGDGRFDEPYTAASRFKSGTGTNPEELLGAAHAACFSMALSHGLAQAGHAPERVRTDADVQLEESDGGFSLTTIRLKTEARVPGLDENTFQQIATEAKENCPVSKALKGCNIELEARLA